jgi:hypothetical protein
MSKHTGPGYIYVFRKVEKMNTIKVGLSEHPMVRRKQLHTTGSEWPMNVYHAWRVGNMKVAETAAHQALDYSRTNPRREFFDVIPEQHATVLEMTDYTTNTAMLDHKIEQVEDAWEAMCIPFERETL